MQEPRQDNTHYYAKPSDKSGPNTMPSCDARDAAVNKRIPSSTPQAGMLAGMTTSRGIVVIAIVSHRLFRLLVAKTAGHTSRSARRESIVTHTTASASGRPASPQRTKTPSEWK